MISSKTFLTDDASVVPWLFFITFPTSLFTTLTLPVQMASAASKFDSTASLHQTSIKEPPLSRAMGESSFANSSGILQDGVSSISLKIDFNPRGSYRKQG